MLKGRLIRRRGLKGGGEEEESKVVKEGRGRGIRENSKVSIRIKKREKKELGEKRRKEKGLVGRK
jgi:hypothetical protein